MLPAGRLLPTPQIAVCMETPAIPAPQFASLTLTRYFFLDGLRWCVGWEWGAGCQGQNVPLLVALSYRLLIRGREVIKHPGVSNILKPLKYPEPVYETPLKFQVEHVLNFLLNYLVFNLLLYQVSVEDISVLGFSVSPSLLVNPHLMVLSALRSDHT